MDLYKVRQQLNLGIPLSNIELKVTYYSRVSTDHQEQKSSLRNQIDHFDKMIKDNQNWLYIDGYIDEGISGTSDLKRTNFMKMIEDAKNKKFDLIITKEISRFSRNTLDSIKYTRELLSYGVAILFINDNINTVFPDSELRLTIMASLAQDEIRRLSERVKFGMNESINKGNILGNDMQYGYKKDPVTKNLTIIPKEQQIIKKIFSLYAIQKKSLNEIANIFNKQDIKTRQNKLWTPTTLSRIIRNMKYKGYYCGKKTEVIDYMTKKVKYLPKEKWVIYKDNKKIPPIIEESLWNKANKRLDNTIINKRLGKNKHIYSHKIICNQHNTFFHRRKQCKSLEDYTWLCSKYLKYGKEYCHSANIRESELKAIVFDIIKKLNINYTKLEKFILKNYQSSKGIEPLIKEKITYKNIFNKLQSLLLEKIVVEKEGNNIKLTIYINYKHSIKDQIDYQFQRGYNTKGTKRYTINYFAIVA